MTSVLVFSHYNKFMWYKIKIKIIEIKLFSYRLKFKKTYLSYRYKSIEYKTKLKK